MINTNSEMCNSNSNNKKVSSQIGFSLESDWKTLFRTQLSMNTGLQVPTNLELLYDPPPARKLFSVLEAF